MRNSVEKNEVGLESIIIGHTVDIRGVELEERKKERGKLEWVTWNFA